MRRLLVRMFVRTWSNLQDSGRRRQRCPTRTNIMLSVSVSVFSKSIINFYLDPFCDIFNL